MSKFTDKDRCKEDRRKEDHHKEKRPESKSEIKGFSILGAANKKRKHLRMDFHQYDELCKKEQEVRDAKKVLKKNIIDYFKDGYARVESKHKGNGSLQSEKYQFTLEALKDHSAVRAFYKKNLSQL
jgi:hypothetical protein